MKDVRELQDQLDQLRTTIRDAQDTAQKLAQDRLIDPSAVPKTKRKLRDLLRDF